MPLFGISADFTLSLSPALARECHIRILSQPTAVPAAGEPSYPALAALYTAVRRGQESCTVGPLPEDYLAFWRTLFTESTQPLLHLCRQGREAATLGLELLRDEFPTAAVYPLVLRPTADSCVETAVRTVTRLRDHGLNATAAAERLCYHAAGLMPLFGEV